MKKERLEKAESKYMYVPIDPVEAQTVYSNLLGLLSFIGDKNATSNIQYPLGVAYRLIRRKVDIKLGYSWRNRKKRTSKSEVKSLVLASKRFTRNPVMRIPYKSYQLMEAVIECVEELSAKGIPLHSDYQHFYGQLYGHVFMNKQIQMTRQEYALFGESWNENEDPKYYLYEDFEDMASPFNKVIR